MSRIAALSSMGVAVFLTPFVIRYPASCSVVFARVRVRLIVCVVSLTQKVSSTLPLVVPLRRSAFPVTSPRRRPKSANSMAWRTVLLPDPMSPASMAIPFGNVMVAST